MDTTYAPALALLDKGRELTGRMREHEQAIRDIGPERKKVVLQLRAMNVTYRQIAEHLGVTEQSIYKWIRDTLNRA
jgi:DNA-directed RNA polymerase specialized sigma24 family protein